MNIIISGQSGFIGSKLTSFFRSEGHEVTGIGRADFAKGVNHIALLLTDKDVLINLAGAPIIKRWTRSYSKVLWDSRIVTTRMLSDAIPLATNGPKAFFSTSAVNVYADQGVNTETQNTLDEDFLGTLCQRWEEEALRARIHCRTYIMRLGVVLGKEGGALPQMALPFKLFAGGKIGNGKQVISWIHIDDLAHALNKLIQELPDQNVFNFTAPNPVSNADFSSSLAEALKRPNLFRVPAFALKILYGEGAVTLIDGVTVLPENLLKEGFRFEYPKLDGALENLLG